jgi:hypothetical protein
MRLYGDMPRLQHVPGEDFDPEQSQVFKFMLERSGNTDLDWAQAEYYRVKVFGMSPDRPRAILIYDPKTCETLGKITWDREAKKAKQSAKDNEDAAPIDYELIEALLERYDDLLRNMPSQKTNKQFFKWLRTNVPEVKGLNDDELHGSFGEAVEALDKITFYTPDECEDHDDIDHKKYCFRIGK